MSLFLKLSGLFLRKKLSDNYQSCLVLLKIDNFWLGISLFGDQNWIFEISYFTHNFSKNWTTIGTCMQKIWKNNRTTKVPLVRCIPPSTRLVWRYSKLILTIFDVCYQTDRPKFSSKSSCQVQCCRFPQLSV